MSAALLGLAFAAEAPSPAAKLVLLKLVDHCDDEGRKIYPAVASLARTAMCTDRTVQRVLKLFCEIGLLRIVREGGSGKGNTTHYEMDIETLRRLVKQGWQAVAGGATLGDDAACGASETPASHAENAERDEAETEDEALRVTSCHPKNAGLRVTSDAAKGDMMCHPNPQYKPSILERESAGARGEGKEGEGQARHAESAGHAEPEGQAGGDGDGGAVVPHFREFIAAWPSAAVDSQGKMSAAWAELTSAQKRAALDGIPAYLALSKSMGRGKICAGQTYLAERKWTLIPEQQAAQRRETLNEAKPWSRVWWALFHAGRAAGGKGAVSLMVSQAMAGKSKWVPEREILSARPDALKQVPARGEIGSGFLAEMARIGLHLPRFNEGTWLFLPQGEIDRVAGNGLREGDIG